jgi:hypothetical protein
LKILSVSWNENSDITKVKFNEEFLTTDWVVKADILKDLICIFEQQYDEILGNDMHSKDAIKRSEEILRNWKYE